MPSPRKRLASPSPAVKKTEPARPPGKAEDIASQSPCSVRDIFRVDRNGSEVFLLGDSFPCYIESDIWCSLQAMGFIYKQGFRYNAWGSDKVWDHEDQVREFMLQTGIPPDTHEALEEQEDIDSFKRWVAFAHVPLKPNEAPDVLRTLPLPSDHQALLSLLLLGFHIDGSTQQIYRTCSDGITEEFDSIQQLRNFVRAAETDNLLAGLCSGTDDDAPRKRPRRTTRKQDMAISEYDLLALRLWAALSPDPLPGEPPETHKKKKVSESEMDVGTNKEGAGECQEALAAAPKDDGEDDARHPEECSEADSEASSLQASRGGSTCIIL
jgi:hypothetical protein